MRQARIALLLALTGAQAAAAQQPRAAIAPDSVSVGGVFRIAVRVDVEPGVRVVFPDTLAVPADVEAAARLDLIVDSTGADLHTWTGVWSLTAWRPGEHELPPVRYAVARGGDVQEARAVLPRVRVYSVLPADTAGVEPMPPRDVIGRDRLVWPLVLLSALALALLTIALWTWRRRRPPAPARVVLPPLPARATALLALDRLAELGLLERGDVQGYLFALTAIVRRYLGDVDARFGTDLTTAELTEAMRVAGAMGDAGQMPRAGAASEERSALPGFRIERFLADSDLVKFARQPATVAQARTDHERVRRWIAAFDWPPVMTERAA